MPDDYPSVEPLTDELLTLPSVAAAVQASVEANRARWRERTATKKAFAVLRRKGLSEDEARTRLRLSQVNAQYEDVKAGLR